MGGSGPAYPALRLGILLVLAAVGYAVSAYGLKLYTILANPVAVGMIGGGLAIAVLAEIAVLRRIDLSSGYVFIIAIETLLVLAAAMWLGETLDWRKLMGVALVVAGLAMVH